MKNINHVSKRTVGMMPGWQKVLILTSMLSCSLSGIAYLLSDLFDLQKKIFGGHTMLSLHGSTAVFAIMGLGSVLTFHIKAGWRAKQKKAERHHSAPRITHPHDYWTPTLLRSRSLSREGYSDPLVSGYAVLFSILLTRTKT
ncbi:hypothetical protein [Polynucleobacter sphagniphilus]|uniref:hypothetical protein n=1 Tax=Polynucleobacter sphagniphilus TaxID=1743169 RepID=UPI00096BA119|nr:hypothetical protein [Polynucleobacter sphagniphilus]OLY97157.1 hypothetical protein BOQ04_00225 [Polynucleobacter sphagniphilus]